MTPCSPPNPTTAAADATDAELLRAFARSRDELAFGRLVARHAAAVRSIALRQTGNPHAAEDVAQATFLVLSGRLGPAARSAGRRGSIRPWLNKTCRYCASNWRRGERRRRRRERVAAVPERADPSRPGELAEAVAAAMSRLGHRDRRLIELHHLDDLPWPAVAAALDLTPDAARRAGARAVDRLRESLRRRGITTSAGALLAAVAALVRPARANALPSASAYELAKGTLLMLKLQTTAVTVSALLVVAGLTGGLAAVIGGGDGPSATAAAPASAPSNAPAAAPATNRAPRVPLVVQFADGVAWNLIALGDGEASWRPDGTPTDEPRLRLPGLKQGKYGETALPPLDGGRRWLAVLLAADGKAAGRGVTVAPADSPEDAGIEAPRVADSNERVLLVGVPAGGTARLLLTAPVSDWITLASAGPGDGVSASIGLVTGTVIFGLAAELDGAATVSVFVSDTSETTRVVAFDKQKKLHWVGTPSASTPAGEMLAATFPELPLADVARFATQRQAVATAGVTVAGAASANVEPEVALVGGAANAAPKLPTRAVGVPLQFDNVPFADAIAFLRAIIDVPITLNDGVLRAAGIDPDKLRTKPTNLNLDGAASVGEVLTVLTEQVGPGVAVYVTKQGRIVFTTPADLEAHRGGWAADPDAAIKERAGK